MKNTIGTKIKKHFADHKFEYGYVAGITAVSVVNIVIIKVIEVHSNKLWDAAAVATVEKYGESASVFMDRDGKFHGVLPTN